MVGAWSFLRTRLTGVKDLNNVLSEFYSKHGKFIDAEEWMEINEYQDAAADDASGTWMQE